MNILKMNLVLPRQEIHLKAHESFHKALRLIAVEGLYDGWYSKDVY